MAVLDVQFRSDALNHEESYTVFLPEKGEGPFPVLLQLHGLGDTNRAWLEKSMLVMQWRDLPMIVVMPNGGSSCYLNWKTSGRINHNLYETFIMEDLPKHVRQHFHASDQPWAIGGLSMGGYGSMRLGLRYPDRFASIWSHSAAFRITDMVDESLIDPSSAETDVLELARKQVAAGVTLPRIAFDCGVDDDLISDNRSLDALLTELGVEHTYAEHPGAHTWDYWNDHVQEALRQHADVFGIDWIREAHPYG